MHSLLRMLRSAVLAVVVLTGVSAAELPRLLLPASDLEATAGAPGRPRIPATSRQFRLNRDVAAHGPDWLRPGAQLRLDLVMGQDVILNVDEVATAADGAIEISGRAAGDADSSVVLVVQGDQLSGVAHLSGLGRFQWLPVAPGETELTRISECRPGYCATPDVTTVPNAADPPAGIVRHAPVNGVWDPATEPTKIDILVLYTPKALEAEGSEESLRRRILSAVEGANYRFTNSLVGVRLNPVHIGLLNYADSGSIVTDVQNLRGLVSTLRENYKADLVVMVVEGDNGGSSGVADLAPAGGNANSAFCVLTRPAVNEHETVFAHEIGHLLGANHDREHAFDVNHNLIPGAFPYSFGHRFKSRGVTYLTVMSYDPGTPVPFFSNPNLRFDGVPVGVPATEIQRADNAQTLNRLAPLVAGYRSALSRIGFSSSQYSVAEGAGTITLQLQREGDLNSATRINVAFDVTSSAKAELDYRRPGATVVSFATNQAFAEITIPILQDDLVEGEESLRVTLTGVLGTHGLGTQGAAWITLRDDEDAWVITGDLSDLPETGGERELALEFTGPLAEDGQRELELTVGLPGDTATLGTDVEVTPAQLVFTAGARRQTVKVRALPDGLAEPDETLRIQAGTAIATLRIVDDDRPGTMPPNAVKPWAVHDGYVSTLVALPDGGLMGAGNFTIMDGVARTAVAQIHPDFGVSSRFTPPEILASPVRMRGVPPGTVFAMRRDSMGRWLVMGGIGEVGGQPRSYMIRLRADGSLDPDFASGVEFDGVVVAGQELSDGRLAVGGWFDHVGERSIRGLVFLTADGAIDDTFQLHPGLSGAITGVSAMEILPDGKLLVAGVLERYNGKLVRNLMRLHPDGSLDESFPLRTSGTSGYTSEIAVLPDGRVYVGGWFDTIGGRSHRKLARLNADGSLDLAYKAPLPNGEVNCLLPLPNGQLLVGGGFTQIAKAPRRFLALLHEDGSLDESFDIGRGAGDHVQALAASGDGSLYVAGGFRTFNGLPASGLTRLRLPAIPGSFTRTGWRPDGTFTARVLGLPGARYVVESSSDSERWQPIGNVAIENFDNMAPFAASTESPARFFRLTSTPR